LAGALIDGGETGARDFYDENGALWHLQLALLLDLDPQIQLYLAYTSIPAMFRQSLLSSPFEPLSIQDERLGLGCECTLRLQT
jgi:hypothetical protein